MTDSTTSPTITVFSGLALKAALTHEIIPGFCTLTSAEVVAEFEPTAALEQMIRAGRVPNVLIGASAVVEKLTADGYFSSVTDPFIASAVGMGFPPGRPVPAFDDVTQFSEFLVAARSVAYSRTGASGIYFADHLARLGIADAVNLRATLFAGGFTATAIKDGRADVAIQHLSELLSVRGIQVADAFPSELRHVTYFSAATDNCDDPMAASFIGFLQTDGSRASFLKSGLSDP